VVFAYRPAIFLVFFTQQQCRDLPVLSHQYVESTARRAGVHDLKANACA